MSDEEHADVLNSECAICNDKEDYINYAVCEKCIHWFHPKCLNLDPIVIKNAPKRVPFYCRDCNPRGKPLLGEIIPTQSTEIVSSQSTEIMSTLGINNANNILREISSNNEENMNQNVDDISSQPEDNNQKSSSQSTDDEGHAPIDYIKDHRGEPGNRQFLVVYEKDDEELWHHEDDLDNCVSYVNNYCRCEKIPLSKYPEPPCGAPKKNKQGRKPKTELWRPIEDILAKAITYGKKDGIQPKIFDNRSQLGDKDELFLLQIGTHCFVVLYIAETKTCFVADGENTFKEDRRTRKVVLNKLSRAAFINYLPYYGQKRADYCASSASAIAIEFQRLYKNKTWPEKIEVSGGTLARIAKIMHGGKGDTIQEWLPVKNISWKVQCSLCGIKMATKNRGALNIHKCAKSN